MNTAVKEAITELKKNILLEQDCIKILEKFDTVDTLTEEEYHMYCHTDLRSTDLLGEKLLKTFPFLTYDKRTANCFCYKITGSDIAVNIPQYNAKSVEFVVDNYYESEDEIVNKHNKATSASLDMSITKQEIYATEQFLEGTTVTKAQMAYPYIIFPVCLLTFKLNEAKKTDEALSRLERAKVKLKRLENINKRKIRSETEAFQKQKELLDKYIPVFLNWTKTVNICSKNGNVGTTLRKTITKEEE